VANSGADGASMSSQQASGRPATTAPQGQTGQVLGTAQSFFPQWAQDVNTGLSFLGFCLTAYVTVQVWSIKRQYTARGRLPDLISELEKKGSELSAQLSVWPQKQNEFALTLKVSVVLLNTAGKLLPRSDAATLREVEAKLTKATSRVLTDKDAWDLYGDIQRAIANLQQVSKNLNWK
jgi:hypothetical protein